MKGQGGNVGGEGWRREEAAHRVGKENGKKRRRFWEKAALWMEGVG